MADKNAILGITVLEWRSVENVPAMHTQEYAGESWMQSDSLLLAYAAGIMAVGYCQQSQGKAEFDAACSYEIGKILIWALLSRPPIPPTI